MTDSTLEPIRLVLGRFEDIVSRGLQALVRDDGRLVMVAADVDQVQLESTIADTRAEVVLVSAASLESCTELRHLRSTFPSTRLVVLADQPTHHECRQLIDAGASACLAKAADARELIDALWGGSAAAETASASPVSAPLTAGEVDVLELLRSGRSNAEIAATLHVGFNAVRTHTSSIYRKLGVSCRRELRSGEVALPKAHHRAP